MNDSFLNASFDWLENGFMDVNEFDVPDFPPLSNSSMNALASTPISFNQEPIPVAPEPSKKSSKGKSSSSTKTKSKSTKGTKKEKVKEEKTKEKKHKGSKAASTGEEASSSKASSEGSSPKKRKSSSTKEESKKNGEPPAKKPNNRRKSAATANQQKQQPQQPQQQQQQTSQEIPLPPSLGFASSFAQMQSVLPTVVATPPSAFGGNPATPKPQTPMSPAPQMLGASLDPSPFYFPPQQTPPTPSSSAESLEQQLQKSNFPTQQMPLASAYLQQFKEKQTSQVTRSSMEQFYSRPYPSSPYPDPLYLPFLHPNTNAAPPSAHPSSKPGNVPTGFMPFPSFANQRMVGSAISTAPYFAGSKTPYSKDVIPPSDTFARMGNPPPSPSSITPQGMQQMPLHPFSPLQPQFMQYHPPQQASSQPQQLQQPASATTSVPGKQTNPLPPSNPNMRPFTSNQPQLNLTNLPGVPPNNNNNGPRKIGNQNKLGMHPFADFIGFLVAPMRIQHADSYVTFTVDNKLANIMEQLGRSEKFRRYSDVEQPLQVQLGCFLSGKPPPARNNKYVLITVNGKMIPARLQYTCININRYLQRGDNVIRINCPSGIPQEPYFICQIYLMRCYPATELLEKIRQAPKPSIDQLKNQIKKSFSTTSEIQQISSMVSLKCPITRQRITVPGRSIHCNHIQCFDILNFFSFSLKSLRTKWLCPICNKPIIFDTLFEDTFMLGILQEVKDQDLSEVEIFADATWGIVQPKRTLEDDVTDLTSMNLGEANKRYFKNWPNSWKEGESVTQPKETTQQHPKIEPAVNPASEQKLDVEFVDGVLDGTGWEEFEESSGGVGSLLSNNEEADDLLNSMLPPGLSTQNPVMTQSTPQLMRTSSLPGMPVSSQSFNSFPTLSLSSGPQPQRHHRNALMFDRSISYDDLDLTSNSTLFEGDTSSKK